MGEITHEPKSCSNIESGKGSNRQSSTGFNENHYSARDNKERFIKEVAHRLGCEGYLGFQQIKGEKRRLMKSHSKQWG